ncbi:MAG: tryptophan--tRNA ligase [Candidatus Borkfalkiaceae bacterium]|nr:tryptophan--tRNA ligase [bacterium]MDY2851223.1 tryptophan--tRNA ligase [Christensenellaceae bacterium]
MQFDKDKKILFSAAQPSGIPTIGNYLGAIKNWVDLQDEYNCIYSIADLHCLTVKREPKDLRRQSLDLLALYIACGVNPEKCVLFMQSHVPAHAELTWVLNTITYPGEMTRMTQFKDKSLRHADNVNMGLMDYPVLMAADILLYQTDIVPIGSDQKQHLEIARDIANRFNNRYSPTFVVPDGYIPKVGARIMSLQDPLHKMSKSDDNENAFISLEDDRDTIIRKFKRAVTDSDNTVAVGEDKPGITNLINIYSIFANKTIEETQREFDGKGYGEFKVAVGEVVADKIVPIKEEKERILKDKAYLDDIMIKGAETANYLANKTLAKVYRKVGLYTPDKK